MKYIGSPCNLTEYLKTAFQEYQTFEMKASDSKEITQFEVGGGGNDL